MEIATCGFPTQRYRPPVRTCTLTSSITMFKKPKYVRKSGRFFYVDYYWITGVWFLFYFIKNLVISFGVGGSGWQMSSQKWSEETHKTRTAGEKKYTHREGSSLELPLDAPSLKLAAPDADAHTAQALTTSTPYRPVLANTCYNHIDPLFPLQPPTPKNHPLPQRRRRRAERRSRAR